MCTVFATLSWGVGVRTVQTGWSDVWTMALAVFSHQRIEVQILIGLLAAFAALMVIEGLRANFFPRRRAEAAIAEPEEQIVFISREPPQAAAPEIAPVQPFAARRVAANPKRKSADVRRHKPMRPIIRRMANTELSGHDQEMTA
jgi:hypothetical protein